MILPGTADLIAALPAFIGFVPSETVFSLLVGRDDRVIALAQIRADASDDELDDWMSDIDRFEDATRIILIAVAAAPYDVLVRTAPHTPFPAETLIGLPSFETTATWFELITGDSGAVPDYRESSATTKRALDGWQIFSSEREIFRAFEPVGPELKPTRVRSASSVHRRLRSSIKSGRGRLDMRAVGGILVHSVESRRETLALIDAGAAIAFQSFSAPARRLRGQPRFEALVASALAAYWCHEYALAETAILAAHHEIDCIGVVPVFGRTLLDRVTDLISSHRAPPSVREFLTFGARIADWSDLDGRTA